MADQEIILNCRCNAANGKIECPGYDHCIYVCLRVSTNKWGDLTRQLPTTWELVPPPPKIKKIKKNKTPKPNGSDAYSALAAQFTRGSFL